jgi:hypothetical protein
MVYSRTIDDQLLSFGISGRLYKSNVLLYDHQSESLWSQLMQRAVTGTLVGKRLTPIPASQMKWQQWVTLHPRTLVLSQLTGHARDYDTDPYAGYHSAGDIYFPVGSVRGELAPKERVLGIDIDGTAKAYPMALLGDSAKPLTDRIGNLTIRIKISPEGQIIAVTDSSGRALPHVTLYWFAWQAFHPQTQVYTK